MRHKHFKPFPHDHIIAVTADEYTATYALGELVTLFGLPPPSGKHQNYRWGRLTETWRFFLPEERAFWESSILTGLFSGKNAEFSKKETSGTARIEIKKKDKATLVVK